MRTSPPKEIYWGTTIYCSKENKTKLKAKVKTDGALVNNFRELVGV
jgi:hypothetical protein